MLRERHVGLLGLGTAAPQQLVLAPLEREIEIGEHAGARGQAVDLVGEHAAGGREREAATERVDALGERDQEARASRVGAHDPAQVDDDELGRLGLLLETAGERLAGGEAELALQLDDDRAIGGSADRRAVLDRALALGAAVDGRVDRAQRRRRPLARADEVDREVVRQLAAHGDAPHRVALGVDAG